MKIIKDKFAKTILTVLSVISVALIASCNNDGEDPATIVQLPTTNSNFIRCKIDGVAYEAPVAQILADQNSYAWNFRSDVSGGVSGVGLDFSIIGQAAVGTYTVNPSNLTTVGRLNYRSPDIYSSGLCSSSSGTLIITSKNGNTIEGTFSFTGKKVALCGEAAKVITEGTFKITLQ